MKMNDVQADLLKSNNIVSSLFNFLLQMDNVTVLSIV